MIDSRRKAVIHVARAQLALSDEDYRALLQRVAGVSSSRELDGAGFNRVMSALERLGFRNVRGRPQTAERPGMATPAQIGRIRALFKGYTGVDDDLQLGRWLQKRFHASHPNFLPGWRAGKVIALLTKMNESPHAKRPVGKRSREPQTA